MIDATTGTISVIAHFPNPEHLLKSGGSGKVIIAKTVTMLWLFHKKLPRKFKIRYLYTR